MFALDQSKPTGAECFKEDESVLDLLTTGDRDFSPIPSGSDDPTESVNSRMLEDDDEDQPEGQFLRTKSTRDPAGSLASQITSDKACRVEHKERDKLASSSSSSKETTVFSHNIATMWMMLKDQTGSPLK